MNSKNRRRVSRKRVSRKRVSRKRVSRKRVSRKRISRRRVSRTFSKRRQAIRKIKYRLFNTETAAHDAYMRLQMHHNAAVEAALQEAAQQEADRQAVYNREAADLVIAMEREREREREQEQERERAVQEAARAQARHAEQVSARPCPWDSLCGRGDKHPGWCYPSSGQPRRTPRSAPNVLRRAGPLRSARQKQNR